MTEKFDWKKFKQDLDTAGAIMIREQNVMPSETSLMDFMKFVFEKENNNGRK